MNWLDRYGYSLNLVAVLLWPISLLFGVAVRLRCWLYRHGFRRSEIINVPLIVVGNISVGGAGKTPLVARLVELLREAGYQPGVISRGYGGQSAEWPRHVVGRAMWSPTATRARSVTSRCCWRGGAAVRWWWGRIGSQRRGR